MAEAPFHIADELGQFVCQVSLLGRSGCRFNGNYFLRFVLLLPRRRRDGGTVTGEVRFCSVNKRVLALRGWSAIQPRSRTSAARDQPKLAASERVVRRTRRTVFAQRDCAGL